MQQIILIKKNSLYIQLYISILYVISCHIIYDAYFEFHATSFPWNEHTSVIVST